MVQRDGTNKYYAMKCMDKTNILNKDAIEKLKGDLVKLEEAKKEALFSIRLLKNEMDVLTEMSMISHPFLTKLKYVFQTEARIYFLMPAVTGGTLFDYCNRLRKKNEKMSENQVRLYAM